ncbi:MAG: 30S ribosomal protein S6 [Vampirovibrionales bacterium]
MAKASDVLLPDVASRLETYEVFGLFRSVGEADGNPSAVLEQLIVQNGGTISNSEKPGRRRLAYPIARQKDGFQASFIAKIPPSAIKPLRAALALNDSVLRVNFLKLNAATEKAILNPRQRPEMREPSSGRREGGFGRREGGRFSRPSAPAAPSAESAGVSAEA